MEPKLEGNQNSSQNSKGTPAWAGTLVGALVGILAGVVGLAIEVIDLNFGPPPDYYYNYIPTAGGPVGAFGGVVAGVIAGTIGLWIGQRVTAMGKVGGAISGLVGGAIGAGIGAMAFVVIGSVTGAYPHYVQLACGMISIIPSMVVGAIIGAISGLAVAIFGMTILSAIPMIAFIGCCSGWTLGYTSDPGIGLLGPVLSVVLSVVIWLSVAMMNARRGHAMGAQLYYVGHQGAFGAAIGGVIGAYFILELISIYIYE